MVAAILSLRQALDCKRQVLVPQMRDTVIMYLLQEVSRTQVSCQAEVTILLVVLYTLSKRRVRFDCDDEV